VVSYLGSTCQWCENEEKELCVTKLYSAFPLQVISLRRLKQFQGNPGIISFLEVYKYFIPVLFCEERFRDFS
jgi:hypothetical protein